MKISEGDRSIAEGQDCKILQSKYTEQQDWNYLIATIALKIRQSLELSEILQTTVDEVFKLLQCDRVILYRFEPDWSGQVVVESVSDPQWSLLDRVVVDACFESSWLEPYQESKFVAIADVEKQTITPCHAEFLAGFQIKAKLVVPVLHASNLWGLLIAHNCVAPRPWQPQEIEGLQRIAVDVGIAIYQASLLEQLQTAKTDLEAQVLVRTQEIQNANQQLYQLAAIVESSQDAIISKTTDGIITSWNRAAEELFGYVAEEMIGSHIKVLIPIELQEEAVKILQSACQGKVVDTYETQRLHKDGRLLDVALTISPIFDETGRVVGASKIARDISDRKQAALTLQKSEATNRALIRAIPDFLVWMQLDGTQITVVNEQSIHCLYATHGIAGKNITEIMPLEIAQERIQLAQIAIATGELQKQEYEFIDGEQTYYEEARIVPVSKDAVLIVVRDISEQQAALQERKQAEMVLQASESRFQKIASSSPGAIYILLTYADRSIKFEYISARYTEIFEISLDQLFNNPSIYLNAIHPEDRNGYYKAVDHSKATLEPFHHEWRIITPSGKLKWIQANSRPSQQENGVFAWHGVLLDITIQKQAEERLQKSEASLLEAQRIANIGNWEFDVPQQKITWSKKLFDMFGLDPNQPEPIYADYLQMIHSDDRQLLQTVVEQAIANGIPYKIDYRASCPDGVIRYHEGRGEIIKDSEGTVSKLLGICLDITDRKQLELDLKSAKAQLELVLQASSEGFWDWNLITGDIYFSPEWKAMFGYEDHELENNHEIWQSLIFEEDLAIALQLVEDYNSGKINQFSVTQRYHHKNGSTVYILSRAINEKDEQGNLQRMIGSHLDITQLVEIQEVLKTSKMQLSSILDSSLNGIMAFRSVRDEQNKIIDFEWLLSNPTACKLVGRSESDLIGNRLLVELPGNRDEGLFDLYVQVVESGEPMHGEFYYCHDGIDSWFEIIAVKLGDGFAVTFHDITAIKQAEKSLQLANQQLSDRLDDLKQRNAEMLLLSEISDFLQACLTVQEACNTISSLLEPLFPECSGSIFITNSSRNQVEKVASWGNNPHSQNDFHPQDCWGLRRGKVHFAGSDRLGLRCNHVDADTAIVKTLCIPMIAQGETLGLFYLSTETTAALLESNQQLAKTVAEQVALAIANLNLRETLQNQSIRDALTGLFNRRYLEESLTKEVSRAQRNQHAIGIVMIDIDHFKKFNDTFGHDAGDYVLQAVGGLLKQNIRGSDVACRYGGEELTLIFPELSLQETAIMAEMIREAIAQLKLSLNGQFLGTLTASLGVAAFPEHGTTGTAVMQSADAALYRAKAAGRDRVMVAP